MKILPFVHVNRLYRDTCHPPTSCCSLSCTSLTRKCITYVKKEDAH
jgi:hypothetical protein